ncbi:MAG: HesA/MoeB/ThiF family protein [Victivallales bacterium]|jgi:molybdopterin-synthase adenylyltransferase|nr:HesA/MoeB/ThiF family protein [Victivallales bacterium]MBT7164064.1 HesA/MoeB/ThiF family protein [Victivallales bacterium]MBT7301121.1 HesA/MoeB/ThiF family protein [Victivallales bacterium]
MTKSIALTAEEKARYEWQIWTPDFGEEGQEKLKGSAALVSRCGGLGSVVAYELAAAGVGRLAIAHGGNVKPSDLNRQLLMTTDWLGKPRVESAIRRLADLNPNVKVEPEAANIDEENAERLVASVDVVASAAPLFVERFLMNREAVRQGKIMVDAAMYDTFATVMTVVPGEGPCLSCLYPEDPPAWRREFPVFGATSGTVACIAALEVVKAIAGFGKLLVGELLVFDLLNLSFRKMKIKRNPNCPVCKGV